jgi:hypothetical protein
MKNKIIIVGFIFLLLAGCSKDWFDVNNDPNNPTDVPAELALTAGIVEVGNVIGGYYNLVGGMWAQYWTQSNAANQHKEIDGYNLNSSDNSLQLSWSELYAGALNDLKFAKTKAETEEQWDVYLMAVVMQAYAYQALADFHDEVPFKNALNGVDGDFAPTFDKGNEVYVGIVDMLNTALAKDIPSSTSLINPAQDVIFKGNVAKWIAFANTLKLKIYMRQMYVDPTGAGSAISNLISSGVPLLMEDASINIFVDEKFKDNPTYSSNVRNLNVGTNLRVSATLFNYLEGNSDPRLAALNSGAPNGTTGIPLPQGGFNYISTIVDPTTVAVFKLSPTTPVYFFTKAECHFLLAEAIAKGWATGDDKAHYDAGVSAAFEMYAKSGDSFIADGGAYAYPSGGSFEQKQEAILMQKWVSMAGIQGLEAFLEINRAGIPKMSAIPAGLTTGLNPEYKGGALTYSMAGTTGGEFPKRLLIPASERNSNSSLSDELKAKKVTDKVWWDKK